MSSIPIYNDISYNNSDKILPKLRLFFNLPDHACKTLQHKPDSVVDDYLNMHKKDRITQEDIFNLIKFDFENTVSNYDGLQTNVIQYLRYYIDVSGINNPPYRIARDKRDEYRKEDYDFTPIINRVIKFMFDGRDAKIFLLTELSK